MGIDLWFWPNFSAPRPPILKVKVLKWPPVWGICFNAKESGFPVQPDEKIRKNRVFWSTYREGCYHTFDNSVVHHILHLQNAHMRTHMHMHAHMPACRPSGILRSKELLISKKVSIPCCSASKTEGKTKAMVLKRCTGQCFSTRICKK